MSGHAATSAHSAHIEALQDRHSALSMKIEREQGRPYISEWYLRELKRQKLRLKDEIEGVRGNA